MVDRGVGPIASRFERVHNSRMADRSFDFSDPDARSFCPQCFGAFLLAEGTCHLCDVPLLSREAAQSTASRDQAAAIEQQRVAALLAPVVVYEAHNQVEAGGVAAHLDDAGVPFQLRRQNEHDPYHNHGPYEIVVAPEQVDSARAVIESLSAFGEGDWEPQVEPETDRRKEGE